VKKTGKERIYRLKRHQTILTKHIEREFYECLSFLFPAALLRNPISGRYFTSIRNLTVVRPFHVI